MINKQLINLSSPASSGGGTGNQEEGLILHLDANDVDSYDGDGTEWVDITNHEYTPATNVSEHFNTVLYTGNSGDKTVTGVGFAPDLVWIKNRDGAFNHLLRDTVRGNDSVIQSNTTTAEATATGTFEFLSDGFRLPIASSGANNSAYDYVAWCFKAGGAAVSNTDGTITSQVSANNDLGFSIVKYTGNTTSGATVGHGLSSAPELVILKTLESGPGYAAWAVQAAPLGGGKYLYLDQNIGADNSSGHFNNTLADSSVITLGNFDVTNDDTDIIAYCFASKRGVSKVGSYVGKTGSVKVYTGFEPAFVLIKKTNTATNGNWSIFDNARVNGTVKGQLYPDLNSAENDRNGLISFNGDGFTLENNTVGQVNTNNDSYIYYAVAKNTNETSLIPDKDDFTAGSIETTNLELDLDANDYSGSGNWLDGTSNNNDGTISGAAYVNDGSSDYFNFDGVDDYVQTSYSPTGLNSITSEYWVNADVVGATKSLGVVFFNGGGRIDFTINSNSNNTPTASGNVVALNKTDFIGNWNKVTIVLTGLASTYNTGGSYASAINASIYYNGEFINTVNPQPYQTPVLGARLGRSGGGYYFDGKIGQARIYSSALTPTQIKSNYDATKIYALADLELHLDAASFPQYGEAGYSNTPPTWTALTGSNGTISGATFDSELGNYLDFDGSDDYISFPQFDISSDGVFTLEMWVNPDSTQNQYANLFDYGHDGSTGFTLQQSNTSTNNYYFYSQGVVITFYIPPNQWTQVVVTVDANDLAKFYLDGSLIGTSPNIPVVTTGRTLNIGRWAGGASRYWRGKIGQVRTYSSALSQDQIRQNYNFTKPSYPNGFDSTISGATWNPSGYFEFNGSSHFAYIDSTTNSSPVDFSKNNYSIAAWVNLDNVNTFNYVLSKYGTSDSVRSIIFGVNDNGTLRLLERSSSTNNQSSTGVLTSGAWYHIAVVRTFDKISFYINGSLDTEISSSFIPNDGGNQRITIGRHESTTPLYFDGKMSDIKLYDKALTSSEVASQFAIKQFQIG